MLFSLFNNKWTWKLLLSILLMFGAIVLFSSIIHEIFIEKEQEDDLMVFEFFKYYIIRNSLTGFMIDLTHLSAPALMKILYPFLIVALLIFQLYRKAAFAFLAGAGGLGLIYLLKILFQRPRPLYPLKITESGYSFPSGHATFSFIFYGTLAYFFWLTPLPKIVKIGVMAFLILLSFGIGISRIYLRVHYPSDVFAGFCLGYTWLFLLIYYFRRKYPLD